VAALPAALGAQWSVAAEIGTGGFGGAAMDTSAGGGGTARPYNLTTIGARLEHARGPVVVGVVVLRGGADVAIDGPDILVAMKHQFRLVEIAVRGSVRVARPGAAVVRLVAGPLLDRWSPEGGERRDRAGGEAGVLLEWSLGGRVSASLRGAAALTKSVFQADELPAGYERHAMWRRMLAGSVHFRL
jgi:hypothetical protein